ncbi:hypothetical protein OIO90_006276 [Microbotryomycetes sp. JL221]|nr:hypothetical protein OIO90_006276 [Microbotryomycetes sp. JL221]
MSGMMSRLVNSIKGTTSSSSTTSPTTAPRFIYKVFPHATVNQFFFFPSPIPASHEFKPTESDAKDGFVHLCTRDQLGDVVNKWFNDIGKVTVLKVDYGRLNGFKIVKWEQGFPHLYGFLEGEYIDSFQDLEKSGEARWDKAVEQQDKDGWLE